MKISRPRRLPPPQRTDSHQSRHYFGRFIIWNARGARDRFIELTGAGATLWALIDGRRSRSRIADILKKTFGPALDDAWIELQFRTLHRLRLLRRGAFLPRIRAQDSRRCQH